MTIVTRATLKTYYQTGDFPSASNFADLIDSCANLEDTTAQVFQSSIGTSATVSAGMGEFTVVSATTGNISTLNAATVNTAVVSATTINTTNFNAASTLTSTGVTTLKGTTTNDNAAAGNIGEYITNTASGVAMSTGSSINITSISLTAGDWDVSGIINYGGTGSTTVAQMTGGINSTTGTLPTPPAGGYFQYTFSLTGGQATWWIPTGITRVSIATTTIYYLVAQAIFGASTLNGSGIIRARRIR